MGGKRNKMLQALVFVLSLCCLLVILFRAPQHPSSFNVQSRQGQIVTQQGTVRVQGPVRGPLLKSPPATRSERERGESEEREHPSIKTPIDPTVRTEDIRPTNPETVVRLIPEHLLESPQRHPAAPQAPGSF